MPYTIQNIQGREIYDSRGFPTLEVDVILKNGVVGRASVPAGASKGKYEAFELRDHTSRLQGKGVQQAVAHIKTEIKKSFLNQEIKDQRHLDQRLIALDRTQNKQRLGANTLLGVSLAFARACALAQGKFLFNYLSQLEVFPQHTHDKPQLPTPLMNVLNGGMHAKNNLDIQEFMIVPLMQNTFADVMTIGAEVYHTLGALLDARGYPTTVGDEGGFAPDLSGGTEEALDLIIKAIEKTGFCPKTEVVIALDVAASQCYRDGLYHLDNTQRTSEEMIDYYKKLITDYPIFSIEDGMDEDDVQGWQKLTKVLGRQVQLVGDDLFATHPKRLARGVEQKMANSILIKLNQIGTLTEACDVIVAAQKAGYTPIISQRSGETEDPFIADLAVGAHVKQIKAGAPARSERLSKYNQLLRIAFFISSRHAIEESTQTRKVDS